MTEALPVDLTYGHPGEASYDERRHKWGFSRIPGLSRRFSIIHETVTLHSHIAPPISSNRNSAYTRSQNIKNLTRSHPDLGPAAHLLPSWAQESDIIERYNSGVEPLKSELIAFCDLSSADPKASDAPNVQIAAVPGGSSGDSVRIVCLNNVQYGWQDHNRVQLLWKTLQDGREYLWEERQGPVQQLCFAEKLQAEHACWLAVRYHTSTSVIQLSTAPKRTQPGSRPRTPPTTYNLAASAFHGNAIVTLPMECTGGASHADVCFSPWSKRRLGILDQEGRWSIWTINRHAQRGELREATAIATGSIHDGSGQSVDLNESFKDGWGRMLWVENPKTILLATRTCLAAFHIEFPYKRLSVPDLNLSEDGDWILDMKSSPSDLSYVFVLTSTRICWLGVDEYEVQKASNTDLSIRSLLSWKHFRDAGDISLKISVLTNGDASVVLLYSRITSIRTFHAFHMSSSLPKKALLAFDPCSLAANNICNPSDKNYRVAASSDHCASITIMMDILPGQIKSHYGVKPPRLGNSADGVEYYQLTALKHDLSVSEILVVSTSFSDSSNIEAPEIIRVSDAVEGTGPRAFDSFVTLDEELDIALTPALHTPSRNQLRHGKSGTEQVLEDSWTLNLAWLHKDLQKHMSVGKIAFTAALNALVTTCEQISSYERPLPKSLFELVDSDPFVADIDMASDSLDNVIKKLERVVSGDVEDIAESKFLIGPSFTRSLCESWGIGDSFILSGVYEMLIDHWLKSLSLKTPSRVRIAIERVARAVASQLCLAAYQYPASLCSPIEDTVRMQENAEQPEVVLTLRHKASATGLSPKGKQRVQPANPFPANGLEGGRGSDFTRPTSSHEGALLTPDRTPSIPSRSPSFSTKHTESLASQRLGALVRLEAQRYDADSTASILKHWGEGVDPWSYDWESTQQAIDSGSRGELVGEPSRAQHGSKAEQLYKRRRVENTGTSSQPQPDRGIQPSTKFAKETHGSSQGDLPTMMSQPEPGLHGSRKPVRLKKEKPGFKN